MRFNLSFFKKEKRHYSKYEKRFVNDLVNVPRQNLEVVKSSAMNFKHSGNCGDIVYALPTVLALANQFPSKLFLNIDKAGNYAKDMKHPLGQVMLNESVAQKILPLLQHQSYIENCAIFDGESINYDLDLIRDYPLLLDRGNIARWYFQVFGTNFDLNKKWISAPNLRDAQEFIVIARSARYNSPLIDYSFIKGYPKVLFIGLEEEYINMRKMIPNIEYRKVNDFLEMASIINSSKLFIGNQSFPFAIAEGLKVNRILEVYFKCPNVTVYGDKGFDFCFQPQFEKLVRERFEI